MCWFRNRPTRCLVEDNALVRPIWFTISWVAIACEVRPYLLYLLHYRRQVLAGKHPFNSKDRLFCNLILLVDLYQSQGFWTLETIDFIFCVPLGVLCDVFAMLIPVLKTYLLLLGWPGVDPLLPHFQMHFFPRHKLSVALDGMILNWIVSSPHRLVRHCSACPSSIDWKYASMGPRRLLPFLLQVYRVFLGLVTLARPNCSLAHFLFHFQLLPVGWHFLWFNNTTERSRLCSNVSRGWCAFSWLCMVLSLICSVVIFLFFILWADACGRQV